MENVDILPPLTVSAGLVGDDIISHQKVKLCRRVSGWERCLGSGCEEWAVEVLQNLSGGREQRMEIAGRKVRSTGSESAQSRGRESPGVNLETKTSDHL